MGDTSVETINTMVPPDSPATTQVTSNSTVRVLVNASGAGIPAFNQGLFTDKLPIQNAANSRTIQSSGCGLCAWTSAIAAAGARVPTFDPVAKTFSVSGSAPLINPSTLLAFLINWSKSKTANEGAAKQMQQNEIFAAQDNGVLRND